MDMMIEFLMKPVRLLGSSLALTVCVALAGASLAASPGESPWVGETYSKVRLVSGSVAGMSDGHMIAGVQIRLDPGWKTYWRMPGDSGVPPTFDWSGSKNLRSAEVLYPAPHRFTDASGTAIGYEDEVVFPVMVTPERLDEPVELKLNVDYGLCKTLCIPSQANLSLELPPHTVGKGDDDPLLARFFNLVPKPADRTLDTLHGMGIVELVSTFTTKFVPGQPRTRNIRIVADLARGRIVPAGGTFSLNELTGERTLAKGYVMAPVIEGGKLKNGPGGGISQFATTAFNAGYYAGMVDVAHKPHSYYFDRYPAVIESTTIYPTVDMAFRNDSPNAILIDTVWTENSITVSIFGTRRYEIETVYGPRTNVTSPPAIPLDEPDCIPTDGLPGFRQEAWRVFKQNGVEIKRERFQWHYRAEPKFVC